MPIPSQLSPFMYPIHKFEYGMSIEFIQVFFSTNNVSWIRHVFANIVSIHVQHSFIVKVQANIQNWLSSWKRKGIPTLDANEHGNGNERWLMLWNVQFGYDQWLNKYKSLLHSFIFVYLKINHHSHTIFPRWAFNLTHPNVFIFVTKTPT